MKKLIIIVLVLSFVACMTFNVSAASVNLIVSDESNFDSQADTIGAWTSFGGEFVMETSQATTAHSGLRVLYVGERDEQWISPYLDITSLLKTAGNGTYTATAYVKLVSASDVGGTEGKIRLIYRSDNYVAGDGFFTISGATGISLSATAWTKIEGTFVVDDALLANQVPIGICFDSTKASLFIDDVQLVKGDTVIPTATPTPTPTAAATIQPTPTTIITQSKGTGDFSSLAYAVIAVTGLGALVIRKKK